MKSHQLAGVAAAILASAIAAQVPTDHWVLAAFANNTGGLGGIFVADPTGTTITQPQPQSTAMQWANTVLTDDNGVVWYATNGAALSTPMEIFVVFMDQNAVLTEFQLTSGPVQPINPAIGVNALALLDDVLWFVTDNGTVGSLDPFAPGQTPTLLPPVPLVSGQAANAMTTDGRELFVGAWESGFSQDDNIFAIDPSAPTPTWRVAANTHNSLRSAQISAMAFDNNGALLTVEFDGVLRRTNLETGNTNGVGGPSPAGGLNACAYNPWLDQAMCVSLGQARAVKLDVGTQTWDPPVVMPGAGAVAAGASAVCEQPFQRFGSGCADGNGLEPRAAWAGLPTAGNSFDLRLRDGSNGFAVLALGNSRTQWSGVPLPLAGSLLGAPGCDLRVSLDLTLLSLTPNGTATETLSLPPNPAISGSRLFAQWLVSTTANALGLLASEGVAIRVR